MATTEPPSQAVTRNQAFALLAVSVFCFGTAWPMTKMGLTEASPVWLASFRLGTASVISAALLVWQRRMIWPASSEWPLVLSVGLFQLGGYAALTNIGLVSLPVGRSIVLAYSTVVWLVPLGALVLGEKITRLKLLAAALSLAGVLVLLNPSEIDWSNRTVLIGHGWLLLAALSWAIAILHVRAHRWRATPLQLLPWQMAAASLMLLPLAFWLEPDGGIGRSNRQIAILAYVCLVSGPFASWSATNVSRALPTVVSGLGFLAVPVFGIFLSTLWLGEPITLGLALGAALIVAGVATVTIDG